MAPRKPVELMPHQEMFNDMEVPVVPKIMAPYRSIAGLLTPQRLGLDAANYLHIDTPEIEAADTEKFKSDLIDVPAYSKNAVSYSDAEKRRDIWVALEPKEYELVARNVKKLGESSDNKTVAARGRTAETTSKAIPAGKRSAFHTIESKLAVGSVYIGQLESQAALLGKLANASEGHKRGLSLRGGDINISAEFEEFRSVILDSMLKALAVRRQWTPQKSELAFKTIEKRMVFERADNEHLSYFEDLVKLMIDYNGAKQAVFKSRKYEMIAQLRKNPIL